MSRPGLHETGSASVAVLAILVLLAAAAGGGALALGTSLARERKSVQAYAVRSALLKEARRVAGLLAMDPTPAADSPLDPIWGQLGQAELPGAAIVVRDVSSRLDPNWLQKNVLTRTGLASLLRPGRSADELQQHREDQGFYSDIQSGYGDLFNEGWEPYLTSYGYANINLADEFALERLFLIRTGDQPGSKVFHSKIQDLLMAKRLIKPTDLRDFLGADFQRLFPVVNAEPVMNSHFVDQVILSELLAYPDLKVPDPARAAGRILSSRGAVELTEDTLKEIIAAPDDSRIYQYLGVTTWFWQITVSLGSHQERMVVARLPSEGQEPAVFVTVEERYSR
jgi:hypothetical protein